MKIPQGHFQFDDTNALVIAAGKQRARFYSANKGHIREFDYIEVENPKYSDREGFFMRSGSGKTYGAGAPYENKKQKIEADFLKAFEKKISKHLSKFAEVYLFSPNYMHRMIESKFPKGKENLLKKVFLGNIVDTNPLKFIDKIEMSNQKKAAAQKRRTASPEVKKILRKPTTGRKK